MLLFKSTLLNKEGKQYLIKKKIKIEWLQKEGCCFLTQALFEQRLRSKFNLANYIHQNCFDFASI
jgi:hypothetical protein